MGMFSTEIEKLKNAAFLHILKGTLTRHLTNAGVTPDENSALAMIEAGVALPGPIPPLNPVPNAVGAGAVTGQFSNLITAIQAFITTNLTPDLQLLIADAPLILQLISMFTSLKL